jgi:hypothetical protein
VPSHALYCIILHCCALRWYLLSCIVPELSCTALFSIVFLCHALSCDDELIYIVMHYACIVLRCTALSCTGKLCPVLSWNVLHCPVQYCIVHCQVLFGAVVYFCPTLSCFFILIQHFLSFSVKKMDKYAPVMLQQDVLCQTLDAVRFMAVFESVYSIHDFNMQPLGSAGIL